ncbi:MAG TPA: aldose 1-epimerase [Methylomirabilota bacterium]
MLRSRASAMERITLRAGGAGLTLAPSVGGAVTRYWWERDGAAWEWLRPTAPSALRDGHAHRTAAFPLVPFSNRIRAGRFVFGGRAVTLPLNRRREPHAIHGHGWQARWRVVDAGASEARLEYRHAPSDWPWAYRATQRFALTPTDFTVALALTNESDAPMPAGLGWHPYFPRAARTRLTAEVRGIWLTDRETMPTTLARPEAGADASHGLVVSESRLDNCFVGWSRRALIEWPEREARLAMTAQSPLDYLVIFTPPGRRFFCAEPVSHVTDAVNLAAAGHPDTGLRILQPGETLTSAITLTPAGAATATPAPA